MAESVATTKITNGKTHCEMNNENTVAAAIIFAAAIIGILLNAILIALNAKLPQLRNIFGLLYGSHCIASIGFLAVLAFWGAPLTFLNACELGKDPGYIFGPISNYFWYVALYSQIVVAFNRFIAIARPLVYGNIFSWRNATIIVLLTWLISLLQLLWYFFGCVTYFSPNDWGWASAGTSCDTAMYVYGNLYFDNICVANVYLIDFLTYLFIRKRRKTFMLQQIHANDEQRRHFNIEFRFFVQAFLSDTVLVVSVGLYCWLSQTVSSNGKWTFFLATSLIWELHHVLDAVVYLLYNQDTRSLLANPAKLCDAIFKNNIRLQNVIAISARPRNTAITFVKR